MTTCAEPDWLAPKSVSIDVSAVVYIPPRTGSPSPMKRMRTANFLIAEPLSIFLNSSRPMIRKPSMSGTMIVQDRFTSTAYQPPIHEPSPCSGAGRPSPPVMPSTNSGLTALTPS